MRTTLILVAAVVVLAVGCGGADDAEEEVLPEASATTAGEVTWTFADITPVAGDEVRVRASHDAGVSCDVGFTLTLLDDAGSVLAAGSGMVGGLEAGTRRPRTWFWMRRWSPARSPRWRRTRA